MPATLQTTRRPPSRVIQARVMLIVNVPMRRVLSLPFPTPLGKRLMLLTLTGRRTGRLYRQPVSYVRYEDTLLTPGGGRWTLNLSDRQPTPIRLLGREITAQPELVEDPTQVDELLRTMIERNPSVARFVRIPQSDDGTLDRAALSNAIEHGFRVVRWHLHPADLPTAR